MHTSHKKAKVPFWVTSLKMTGINCGTEYEIACPKCHAKPSIGDLGFRPSVQAGERIGVEPRPLIWLRKLGGTIFAGGLGTSTLAILLEVSIYPSNGINVTELELTLFVSFCGGFLFLMGWLGRKIWKR